MRLPSLPPHIAWPMLVVSLLSISITASVYTLFAAQSDGGPAIVKDYYQKGKNWDATARARHRGSALQMDVSVLPPTGDTDAQLRPVVLTIRSADGAPVQDLRGMVRLSRPQTADVLATVPLSPVAATPGTYRQLMPIHRAGLWDVELQATRDGSPLSKTVRVEVP